MSGFDSCILCRNLSFVDTPYHYVFRGRIVHIVQCSSCGLGTLQPMLSSDEVFSLYGPEYFERDYHCGVLPGRYEEEVENLKEEMHSLLPTIEQYSSGKSYLEVGCAGGAMLSAARERGFETTGVELSREMADWGIKFLDLDIRIGTLEEQQFADHSFDVVFLGDVVEHLLSPQSELKLIHRILKPKGIIVLAYPMDLNHLVPRLRRLLRLKRQSPHHPYHLYYFDLSTMGLLLQQSGFKVLYERERKLVRRVNASAFCSDTLNGIITWAIGKWGDRGFTVARTH